MHREEHFKAVVGRDFVPKLGVALWVFDIDRARVVWANDAGLGVWGARDPEELFARDLAADMSPVVARRLKQYQEDFVRHAAEFRESWTIYPRGIPRTLDVVFRGIRLPDERMGMFCEAPGIVRATPEALRSAEAVLHTSVCISLLDPEGVVLYANTAARTCYGGSVLSAGERFGDARDYDRLLGEVEARGLFGASVEMVTTLGRRWHHVLASRCFDAVTGRRAILLSENDVSEAHEAKQVLVDAHNAAVEASRLKTEFVANMSHEIRTPLNGVLGIAQLLARTDLSEQQRELVATLRTSGESLMAIIEDILDVSRIEAGLFNLNESLFSVGDLLKEVASTLYGSAAMRKVVLVVEDEVATNHQFGGDAKRIKQVLINLVGNAVKFSSGTPVTLRARDLGDGRLEFAVRDEGPGISEADQTVIFERFRQAGGTFPQPQGGAGLGLSISKGLVEKMGGEIGVASRMGEGATFWIRLPAARVVRPAGAPLPAPAPVPSAGLDGLRVLLADDNQTNQFIIRRLCELSGMTVVAVQNGLEAVAAAQNGGFDVVLMDIHMPELSGAEAIVRIRASAGPSRAVPIIVLSADAMELSIKEIMALGADEYLTKPIDAEALLTQIGRLAGHAAELIEEPPRRTGAN